MIDLTKISTTHIRTSAHQDPPPQRVPQESAFLVSTANNNNNSYCYKRLLPTTTYYIYLVYEQRFLSSDALTLNKQKGKEQECKNGTKKQGGGAGRAAKALPRAFSFESLQNLTSSKLAFYKVLVLKALPVL
jgi:hypothetical protein